MQTLKALLQGVCPVGGRLGNAGLAAGEENDNAPSLTVSLVLVQCGALHWGVDTG
jgi:hypothetical protein